MANVLKGTCLAEADFSAMEPKLVGWFARSPSYIRIATAGTHAALASYVLNKPVDLTWNDADLKAYLSEIKVEAQRTLAGGATVYDVCKRVVNGSAYCLTPHGMVQNYPTVFKTVASAKKYQQYYYDMSPDIPTWQKSVQKFAYDHGYLGGPGDPPFGHPFGYRHWFYAVSTYSKISEAQAERRAKNGNPIAWFHGQPYAVQLGEDAKRAVAFYPQSTGRGILTEVMLRLFDPEEAEATESYIGDAYYGYTPLRAPIHDSLFLEIPRRISDKVLEIVVREMTRPVAQMPNPAEWNLGSHLSIDVELKVGQQWSAMTKVKDLRVEAEPYAAAMAEEEEDVEALQVEVA